MPSVHEVFAAPAQLTPPLRRLDDTLNFSHRLYEFAARLTNLRRPWLWLSLQAVALWPHWHWTYARFVDGSDDPFGIVAWLAIVILLAFYHAELKLQQTTTRTTSLVLTVIAVVAQWFVSPLPAALCAVLALAVGTIAYLPQRFPKVPVLGLFVLSLPLLSSLQFYFGYPLRVITAAASQVLLESFFATSRDGTLLLVNGKTIIVDAPCSGVQLVWFAYFCACLVGVQRQTKDMTWLTHLPLVGLLVLMGNTLRNSVLVITEVAGFTQNWLHEAIGIVTLLSVCAGVIYHFSRLPTQTNTAATRASLRIRPNMNTGTRVAASLFLGCFISSTTFALRHHANDPRPGTQIPHEWPMRWDQKPLRPLALSPVEQRFAQHFPGTISRLTDGKRAFILRQIKSPTRMLHPATDCYRGLGYGASAIQLEVDASNRAWRCFTALKSGAPTQRVCEQIQDAEGKIFTDTSAWFWAAQLYQSKGPWLAITITTPLARR